MKLGGFEEELTQLSVGVVWLVVHIGGGYYVFVHAGVMSRQLEHMAFCQQLRGVGLFLLIASKSVYLSSVFSLSRGQRASWT